MSQKNVLENTVYSGPDSTVVFTEAILRKQQYRNWDHTWWHVYSIHSITPFDVNLDFCEDGEHFTS